jgi:hypothetical protein
MTVSPTNPFHLARAYAAQPAARLDQPRPVADAPPVQPIAAIRPEPTSPAAQRSAKLAKIDSQLVGAVVPGSIDFTESAPRAAGPSAGVLPMYANPTQRNAVETVLLVGRGLDISG